MRRLLRIILWMVKGVLLLIALAALVMWPVSRVQRMAVSAERYTAGPTSWEHRWYTAKCWDGRAVIGHYWEHAWTDPWLAEIREQVESVGDGWRWKRWSNASTWDEGDWRSRWGPLRWDFTVDSRPDATTGYRVVAAPLWTIALAAGPWPLTSITFALRRRIKRRRAAREGLCKHCGYDLRATPAAGGALLAVCPECGRQSPAGNKPSPPPS